MFRRRRPFGRRPVRRLMGRRPPRGGARPLNPRWQRELRRANHLLNVGEHASAADIFLSLAQRARDRAILGPAAFLFLQAGRASFLAEDIEPGIKEAQIGLKMLIDEGRWPAFHREGRRFAQGLEEAGHGAPAAEFRDWLQKNLENERAQTSAAKTPKAGQIPEICPYCGASMSLEQVNARTQAAECHYCGSVVLSE